MVLEAELCMVWEKRGKSNLPPVTALGKAKCPGAAAATWKEPEKRSSKHPSTKNITGHHRAAAQAGTAQHGLGCPAMPRPPRTVDAALESRAEGRKHSMDISLSSSRS